MIIIEVKFGPINGNPISIDNKLSTTSTNPVENRVIAQELEAIRSDIYDVQNGLEDKEVVTYTTESELSTYIDTLISEGTEDEITAAADKLFYVTETNKLYKFDGEELHEISNDEYIIIVGDEDSNLDGYITNGSYKVIWITTKGSTFSSTKVYTLTVENTTRTVGRIKRVLIKQVLSNRDGWRERASNLGVWGEWTDHLYSYEGHTHTTDDIEASDSLQTTDKTLVGAINEVLGKANVSRMIAVNFYDDEIDYAQWHNLLGDIRITDIRTTNIQYAYISDGGSIVKQNIETLLESEPIAIANESAVTLDIIRHTEGFAALTIIFEKA